MCIFTFFILFDVQCVQLCNRNRFLDLHAVMKKDQLDLIYTITVCKVMHICAASIPILTCMSSYKHCEFWCFCLKFLYLNENNNNQKIIQLLTTHLCLLNDHLDLNGIIAKQYSYASSNCFLIWMSFHTHCKAVKLLLSGLPQCGLLWPCCALPFHTLCKF